mmetsp:Transcript_967/g.2100  ORF Transcript_967/g.2100 Transcript_967/m.2100 type:complete len:509 (+) Transcript_967:142-1668(+)
MRARSSLAVACLEGDRLVVGGVDFGPLADLDIALSTALPGEVLLHAAQHKLVPGLLVVLVGVDGIPEAVLKPSGISSVEFPPRPRVREGVVLLYGVLQTAGSVDYGDSAVALRVQLRQTARLVPGRHDEDVGASEDLVLHLRGESDVAGSAPVVVPLCVAEEACVPLVARAHHDHLDVAGDAIVAVHEPGHNSLEDIDTLLVREPPDEGDHRTVGALRQVERRLEVGLAASFPCDVVRAEEVVEALAVCAEVVVRCRVPLVNVDAVQHAVEVRESSPACVLKAPAALRREDLVPVAGRNSDDSVSQLDASLEQLDLPVVVEHIEVRPVRQSEVMGVARREPAPVAHVVDVEDCTRVLVAAEAAVVGCHDQRDKADHPIVADEDHVIAKERLLAFFDWPVRIGVRAVDAEGSLQSRPAEESEAHQVVVVPVHAPPLVATLLHEHVIDTTCRLALDGWDSLAPLPPVLRAQLLLAHPEFLPRACVLRPLVARVQRRHSHNAMSETRQRTA